VGDRDLDDLLVQERVDSPFLGEGGTFHVEGGRDGLRRGSASRARTVESARRAVKFSRCGGRPRVPVSTGDLLDGDRRGAERPAQLADGGVALQPS
jgi:hypothetical protein